ARDEAQQAERPRLVGHGRGLADELGRRRDDADAGQRIALGVGDDAEELGVDLLRESEAGEDEQAERP
ncbi:MAG TPA: hypothetical protein VLN41_00175, partial [Candidatus Bathyarchaeia archaeon]|nr:hypothetical protein [Candidatus Bathyarchaeia archaeon]